ncbi:MAG: hypothetical protein O9246_01705, partial [Brevundimonas sp.]|nr:hypothetical protein [Brevundimonas sp.]
EIDLAVEPGPPPLQDVGAVLLVRMGRLFLSVIRRRWKKRHSPEELAALRKAAARTVDTLWDAIARIIQTFSPQECRNYFSAAGYDAD